MSSNVNVACRTGRPRVYYDPLGRMHTARDEHYTNLVAECLQVPKVAAVGQLITSEIFGEPGEDLQVYVCQGNVDIQAPDGNINQSANFVSIQSNTDVYVNVVNGALIVDGNLCVTDIISCNPDGTINIHGNINLNSATTYLTSVGGGIDLVEDGIGPCLFLRTLVGQGGINVSQSGNTVIISGSGGSGQISNLYSNGAGQSLVVQGLGPDLAVRSLIGQNGINVIQQGSTMVVSANANAFASNVTSLGTGQNVIVQGSGNNLQIMTIQGQGSITTYVSNNTLIISDNVTNTVLGSNGTGTNLVSDSQGPDLFIKSLTGQGIVTVYNVGDDVFISANASGVNLAGTGNGQSLVVQGTGPTLQIMNVIGSGDTNVWANGNTLVVSSNANLANVNLQSNGTGTNLVSHSQGPSLAIKSLQGQGIITVSNTGDTVFISANSAVSNLSGTGNGQSLVVQGTGPGLQIMNVIGFADTNVWANGNTLVISSNANLANVNLQSNGTGTNLVSHSQGPSLAIKSLQGQGIITVSNTGDTVFISANSAVSNLSGTGNGQSLVVQGNGPSLQIMNVIGSGDTNVWANGNTLVVSSNANLANVNLASNGTGTNLVSHSQGPSLAIKTLQGQGGISVSNIGDTVFISANANAFQTNLSGTGNGQSLVVQGNGPSLQIMNVIGFADTNVWANGNTLVISSNANLSQVNLASNGTGTNLVSHSQGPNLAIKTLQGQGGISVSNIGDTVFISANANAFQTNLSGTGNGQSLVVQGNGPSLQIMNVIGSGDTNVWANGNTLVISSNANLANVNLASNGTGVNLVSHSQGPNLAIKTLQGQGGIAVTNVGDTVFISANANAFQTNLSGTGNGQSLVVSGTGPNLVIMNVIGFADTNVWANGNTLVISSNANLANVNLASNGAGTNLVSHSQGPNLAIKSLQGQGVITVSNTGDTVIISANANDFLTNLAGTGNGQSLVVSGTGPNLVIMNVIGSGDTNVWANGNTLVISSNANLANVNLQSNGTGVNLVSHSQGPNLAIKSLQGQGVITVSNTGDTVIISANANDFLTNLAGTGNGQSLVVSGTGPNLVIMNVIGSGDTNVWANGNTLVVSSNLSDVSLGSNGSGINLVSQSQGPDMFIKSLQGQGIITVSNVGDTVFISANSAVSNLSGTGNGLSLVVNGTGPNLQIMNVVGLNDTNIFTDGSTLFISSNANLANVNLQSNGTGTNLVSHSQGPNLAIKSLQGQGVITVSNSGDTVIISANANDFSTNLAGTGNGQSLIVNGTGPNLVIMNVIGSGDTNVWSNGNTLVVSSNANLANVNLLSNGTGNVNLVSQSQGPNLAIKTLQGQGVITVSNTGDTVFISANANDFLTNLEGTGNGQSLVVQGTGPVLQIMNVIGSGDTNVWANGNTMVISSNANLANVNLASNGTGTNLVSHSQGPNLAIKSLQGQGVITVSNTGDTVIISANANDFLTNLAGTGNGQSLVVNGTGPNLVIMNLIGSGDTNVWANGNTMVISSNANLANVNLASNGTGINLVSQSQGPNLAIKSLQGQGVITVYNTGDTVIVSANANDFLTNLSGTGNGQSLVVNGTGPNLQIMNVIGFGNTNVWANGNTLVISSNLSDVSLGSNGSGVNLVSQGQGPSMFLKSLVGQGVVNVQVSGDNVIVSANANDFLTNLSGTGNGNSIVVNGTGPNLVIMNIAGNGAANVYVDNNTLVVDVPNVELISVGQGISLVPNAGVTKSLFAEFGMSEPAQQASYAEARVSSQELVPDQRTYLLFQAPSTSGSLSVLEGWDSESPDSSGQVLSEEGSYLDLQAFLLLSSQANQGSSVLSLVRTDPLEEIQSQEVDLSRFRTGQDGKRYSVVNARFRATESTVCLSLVSDVPLTIEGQTSDPLFVGNSCQGSRIAVTSWP